MEGLESWKPETGTPQGAVISPLLANIYLNPLDHMMSELGYEMVRYADDFVVLCKSKEEAEEALKFIKGWMNCVELTLHPDKTKIADVMTDGFEFLGYRFHKDRRYPRKKSLQRLKEVIRSKTKRNNGKSLEEIAKSLNLTLKGWYEYYKHSRKSALTRVDEWTRRRLRTILKKRTRKISRWQYTYEDHRRWPIAFFHELGLFSLTRAQEQECRSLRSN